MSRVARRLPRSLLGHLLAWTLGALALVWLSFVVAGYRTGLVETDELTDGHLASVAALLVDSGLDLAAQAPPGKLASGPGSAAPADPVRSHDYQVPVSVVVWDAGGRVLQQRGSAPLPGFGTDEGFATLHLGAPAQHWRSFARWAPGEPRRRVMVLISEAERRELAWDIASQVAQPGLWLLPAVALALGLAIQRGLRPLQALSDDVRALDVQHAQGLRANHPEREFGAMVAAVNALVQRYHAALQRERELASELAHELRTPLSALVLQARALRESPATADAQALARLEHDALHAGQVLTQLLSLARASHTALAEAARPVDLDALARRVLADCANTALDAGHELALASAGPFDVDGHAVLLELALRNLVDNAIAHTPRGTLVELRLDPARRELQVCDGPLAPALAAPPAPGDASAPVALGLGLGHRVVAKVAAIHHARFDQASPPAGFTRCYRLQFAAPPSAGD